MPLCLIRHTRVAAPAGLCYGQLDVPLADTFAEEARAVREALARRYSTNLPPIWSSPSLRCRSLAETLGAPFRLDPRLRELSFGEWEGRTWAELNSPEARHWGDNWQTVAPPRGESLPELLARLRAFLADLGDTDAIVLTHAGPIRALHHLVAGQTLEAAFRLAVDHGDLILLPQS